MQLNLISNSTELTVRISGELGIGDAEELYHKISAAIKPEHSQLIVDFSRIESLSSHGLAKLALLHTQLGSRGVEVIFRNVSEMLLSLMEILELDHLIQVTETE